MRIGIDIRCLAEERRTGVEEYAFNLLQHIFEMDRKNEYVLFFNSFKNPKLDFQWIKKYPNVKIRIFRYPNKLLNFLFWYFDWPKIDRMLGGTDIFFMPNIIFGSVSDKSKLMVTIHDLSFEQYRETFSWKRKWWHIFINPKNLCRQADKIISVSSSTKNDIVELYGIDPEKIIVIYNGIADIFIPMNEDSYKEKFKEIRNRYDLPEKFILYLGTIEPRKNIVGIVRAYAGFQKYALDQNNPDLADYFLVIAGYPGWLSESIFSEIENSEFKQKIVVTSPIEEGDKVFVYNMSSLVVYCSFFEGFGFPPLEAMRCGIPVIASNNSSLSETVGNSGILIDPDKPQEIFYAMKEILTSKELYNEFIVRGLECARNFDWNKTAEKILEIINKMKDNRKDDLSNFLLK